MDATVAIVLIARNEEKRIAKALESLERQTLRPYRTIVVNDGSTDGTADIVAEFDAELVNRPIRSESYLAKKELAGTINAGLDLLRKDTTCCYVCLSGADILYPENYLDVITARLEKNPCLAIASGTIQDEHSTVPRGAGRVVQCKFWRKVGLRYPVNYGYEGYLLLKAASMGYQNITFKDLVMTTQRRTGSRFSPFRYRYYGLGMRALGYRSVYALGKAAFFATKNPAGAVHMLRGYYSGYDDLYEKELREYVKRTQSISNMVSTLFRVLRG